MVLYVTLDPPIAAGRQGADCSYLAKLIGAATPMDDACRRLGVRSLTGFQSYAPDDLAGLLDEATLEAMASKPINWFDPADALPAVRALQPHYATERLTNPKGRGQKVGARVEWEPVDVTEHLLGELRDTERVLSIAAQFNARFRFHIGE